MDIRLIFRSYLDSFDDAGTQTVSRDAQWFQFAIKGEPDREVRRFDCQEKPLRGTEVSVPQTDTGGREEYSQALG